jgi:hypothetical protein
MYRGSPWLKILTSLDCKLQDTVELFPSDDLFRTYRVLFMGGTSCIIIGFSFATEFGCVFFHLSCIGSVSFIVREGVSPLILSLLIIGVLLLLYAGYHEKHTSRECLFPSTTFNNLSTGYSLHFIFTHPSEISLAVILIITFLHNFAFSAGTFYLALFYQVRPWLYVINICPTHIINRQPLELRPWNPESKVYLTPLGRPWHPCRWLGSLVTGNDGLMTPVVKTG